MPEYSQSQLIVDNAEAIVVSDSQILNRLERADVAGTAASQADSTESMEH
jgi:hypothetical protein